MINDVVQRQLTAFEGLLLLLLAQSNPSSSIHQSSITVNTVDRWWSSFQDQSAQQTITLPPDILQPHQYNVMCI